MADKRVPWHTLPQLWMKLKPQARRMRQSPTAAECRLWQSLRGKQFSGLRFRRQHAIGRFVVDFYCASARLVVEVDGPIHEQSREQDAARRAFLTALGLRVLRFTNEQVEHALGTVLSQIADALYVTPLPLTVAPSLHASIDGCDDRLVLGPPLPACGEGPGMG